MDAASSSEVAAGRGGRRDVAGRRRRSAGKKTSRRKLAKAAGVQEIPTAASVAAVYSHEEEGEAVQVIGNVEIRPEQ